MWVCTAYVESRHEFMGKKGKKAMSSASIASSRACFRSYMWNVISLHFLNDLPPVCFSLSTQHNFNCHSCKWGVPTIAGEGNVTCNNYVVFDWV